ncbi:hypothetical protein QEN19_003125 [Hanseniaspora menglaensis]
MNLDQEYLQELNTPLSVQQFSLFEKLYNDDSTNKQLQFNYAWALIKSDSKELQMKGVRFLSTIFKSSPDKRKECLYFMSLGNYKLKNYELALKYLDALILAEQEIGNKDLNKLDELKLRIHDDIKRTTGNALIGIGIGVSVMAVGISLVNKFWGNNNSHRG